MRSSGRPGALAVREVGPDGVIAVVRYLVACTTADQVGRVFRYGWLAAVAGLVLIAVGPRRVGLILVGAAVVVAAARHILVRVIERVALARRYRAIGEDFTGAIEAGKGNLRRELERAHLPATHWRMPLFLLNLCQRSDRIRTGLARVDLTRVLPQAQIDRAMRILATAAA